ncbi:MAG TPA: YlxR family protein [Methylomirabilota bacterium]|nr:YlxR family protein [Methylomirabilota bacterium]
MSHVPTRTCLGCRQRRPKHALVRLVRRADGVVAVDGGAALPGRGAYVCAAAGCVERALKTGRLAHAFRTACRLGEELQFTVLAAGRTAAAGQDTGS